MSKSERKTDPDLLGGEVGPDGKIFVTLATLQTQEGWLSATRARGRSL